jgi:hypothetical protein
MKTKLMILLWLLALLGVYSAGYYRAAAQPREETNARPQALASVQRLNSDGRGAWNTPFYHMEGGGGSQGQSLAILSYTEREVLRLLNLLRMNPGLFARTYAAAHFGAEPTAEQAALLAELEQVPALEPLVFMPSLHKSATRQAVDMGSTGQVGYNSSQGQPFYDRIHMVAPGTRTFGCGYFAGSNDAVEIVMGLLLDPLDPEHHNRKNLLSPDLDRVGLAVQPHKRLCSNTVVDLAKSVPVPTENLASTELAGEPPVKRRDWGRSDCPPGSKVVVRRKRRR